MKKASEKLMHVEYVMDEFHIVKHFKRLCAGEIGKKYRLAIQTCIESDNKEGLVKMDSIQKLEKAYPNYFAQLKDFQTESNHIFAWCS